MNIDAEALMQEASSQAGSLAARNIMLAGQLGAAIKQRDAALAEVAALKAKMKKPKE